MMAARWARVRKSRVGLISGAQAGRNPIVRVGPSGANIIAVSELATTSHENQSSSKRTVVVGHAF